MEIKEPRALTEILEIRGKLSEQMLGMTPEEQVAFVKKGAAELEKEFNLNLPRRVKK
jgi:hypothetical protein